MSQSKCDVCGKETENLVDYFQLLCHSCKNELYSNPKFKTKKFLKEQQHKTLLGYDLDNFPIIACWRVSDYSVGFYCKFCKKVHTHGWGDGNPNGHRCAHCHNSDSAYDKTGYVLMCQDIYGEAHK